MTTFIVILLLIVTNITTAFIVWWQSDKYYDSLFEIVQEFYKLGEPNDSGK